MVLLAAGLLSSPARADSCKKVDTTIVTSFFVAGCTSPVGLCTAGVTASGPLAGTTRFTALTLVPSPGAPDVLLYTGVLVITTRKGTVTIEDRGLFNTVTGAFFELEQVVAGTGKFKHATGMLTSQGFATGTGFSGTITGMICRGDHEEDRDDHDRDDRDGD
jgi:hypothetical protein